MIISLRDVLCWFLFLIAGCAQAVAQNRQDGMPPQASKPPWATPLGLMQHTADQIETPVDRVRALATLTATLKNSGRNDMAQATLLQMQEVLSRSRAARTIDDPSMARMFFELPAKEVMEETLLPTLIADGAFAPAIRVATRSGSKEERIRLLRQVLNATLAQEAGTFARQTALELQRSGAGDDAFFEISQSLGKITQDREAVELVSLVKSPEAKVSMLVQFALAWTENGNRLAAVAAMRQAQSLLIAIQDEETRTYLAYDIASILMAVGERQQAFELLQQSTTPSERARGLTLATEMLLKSGEVESALDRARRIEVPTEKAAALMRVAVFCANSDDSARLKLAIQQVVSILPAIEERSVRSYLRHRATRIYSEIGSADAGLALLENERLEITQMTDAAARGLAYCELAAAQSRGGASDLARESLTSAKKELPKVTSAFLHAFVLGRVASTESLMNDPARFQSALVAAQEATDEIDDVYKGFMVLQDLSRRLFVAGRPAEAKDLLEKTKGAFASWPWRPEFVHYVAHRSIAIDFRTFGEVNRSDRMLSEQGPPHRTLWAERPLKLFDVAMKARILDDDQEARRMLQQAVIAIRGIENASVRSSMLNVIAAEFVALGNTARGSTLLSEAVAAAAEIESENELTGTLAAITVHTSLIRDFEKASPILDSVLAVGAMRKRPLLEAAVLTQVASAKISYGEQKSALDLLAKASGLGASSSDVLCKVARVQYEAKQGELAAQTLNQAADIALKRPGGLYRDTVLARIVEILVRVGKSEQAIQLAKQLDNIDTVLPQLSIGLVRKGELELAVDVVLKIEDATQRRKALGVVGSQLDREKHAGLVEQVATALEKSVESNTNPMMGLNSPTCQAATALALAGHYERAHALVRRVRPTQLRRRSNDENEIVQGVATRLVRAGKMNAAMDFVRAVPESAYLEEDLSTLAHQLASLGQVDAAVSVMDEVTDETGKMWGLNGISAVCFDAGKTDQARTIVLKIMGIAKSSKERDKNSYALNNLVSTLLSAREYDLALEVSRMIEGPQVPTKAIPAIALALAQSGDSEKALEIIKELLQTVPNYDVVGLYGVASAAANAGDGRGALQLIEELQKVKGDQPSLKFGFQTHQSWLETKALEDAAIAFSNVGELERALRLVERIETQRSKDEVRLKLAYKLVERGFFERAAEVAGAEDRDQVLARMRRVLGSPSIQLGKVSLQEARAMAKEISDQSEHREVLVAIARSFARLGELDSAMETACQVCSVDVSRFEIAVALATVPMTPRYPDEPVLRRLKESFTEQEIVLVNRFAEMTRGN